MDRHCIRALDVHRDELFPRIHTLEHHIWTVRSRDVFRLDCEGKELPADADQHRSYNPVLWRVN